MFNNVGRKIKGVISTVTGILMLASILEGIAVFFILKWELGFWAFLIGVAVAGIGILFSWLANLVGYAFGQLVENSDRIGMSKMWGITAKRNELLSGLRWENTICLKLIDYIKYIFKKTREVIVTTLVFLWNFV